MFASMLFCFQTDATRKFYISIPLNFCLVKKNISHYRAGGRNSLLQKSDVCGIMYL